ncbi:MAG: hypothetical protein IRZ11_08835, partial [Clostridia bacterium]|nr:hypothetical protein [Clostridia bacterium]
MPKSRVARRILSAASLLVVLALALAAPSPGNGPRSDGRTPAVEASAGRPPAAEADAGLEAGHGPAPGVA